MHKSISYEVCDVCGYIEGHSDLCPDEGDVIIGSYDETITYNLSNHGGYVGLSDGPSAYLKSSELMKFALDIIKRYA